MMLDWGTGHVQYRSGKVEEFYNDGIAWVVAWRGISKAGWKEELAPYDGPTDALDFWIAFGIAWKWYNWRERFKSLLGIPRWAFGIYRTDGK